MDQKLKKVAVAAEQELCGVGSHALGCGLHHEAMPSVHEIGLNLPMLMYQRTDSVVPTIHYQMGGDFHQHARPSLRFEMATIAVW